MDLEEWFQKNAIYENSDYEKINIDGLPAIVQYVPHFNIGGKAKSIKEYYIKKGDLILQFKAYTPMGKNSEELIYKFDKIMETFQNI